MFACSKMFRKAALFALVCCLVITAAAGQPEVLDADSLNVISLEFPVETAGNQASYCTSCAYKWLCSW